MTPQQKDILTQKMFDSAQPLSQQEIELIMTDRELLDLYQIAVLNMNSKPSNINITYDMDKEWDRISRRLGFESKTSKSDREFIESSVPTETSSSSISTVSTDSIDITDSIDSHSILSLGFWTKRQWRKYAATIAVFISLTAIAAITTHYIANQNREFVQNESSESTTPQPNQEAMVAEEASEVPTQVVLQGEKIFEGVTLDEIAQELSETFGTTIKVEDNVKSVRLYLHLPQGSSVDDLLTILSQYESLSVQLDSNSNIFIGNGQ